MSTIQPDLFGAPSPEREQPSEEILAIVRRRLHAALDLVRGAGTMPWTDMLDIICEDNAFRFGKDLLPPAEGAALRAAFDVEMDRLYAIANEAKERDPGD
jgi:hypothetical protein